MLTEASEGGADVGFELLRRGRGSARKTSYIYQLSGQPAFSGSSDFIKLEDTYYSLRTLGAH